MSDILSQDEIDQLLLLAKAQPDEVEEPVYGLDAAPSAYDFRQPSKLSRDHLRSIQRIHEQFARAFSGLTSARLRTRVDLSILSIERLSFGEFVNALANPSVISVYSIQPRDGFLILQMNTEMAFILYDRLCGGPGRAPEKPREMTEIELAVLNRQILMDLIRTLEASWQEVSDLVFELQFTESNPQFLQMMAERDAVILVTLVMELDHTQEMINVCMSQSALEPVLKEITGRRLFESRRAPQQEELLQLREHLLQAQLPLEVELGRATLSMEDLLELRIGDVITLERKRTEKLDVRVGQSVKFLASPGKLGQKLGAVITDTCRQEGRQRDGG